MLNRDSDLYKRMTMMRNAFNGNETILMYSNLKEKE